ncbi:hypothetical protein RE474_01250 [Methanolobus sediminis]|uniref:Uncharacterized protein n=1 Tax=Methanolobus sediminis TaxID=3072978 RepID=A0AA51YJA1_9EURY|nr:hypothetical protein [Methanolobus sediminis]WMW25376.1 hypothetical protein RE474_01250 [Methanolobus sediminis]
MGYTQNFISEILLNSVSDNYKEAIKEWIFYGEQTILEKDEPPATCICGHVIRDIRIVHNKSNDKTLQIGNCCISKFGIDRKHFNSSKEAYLSMALNMVKSPGYRDYLKYETLPRIEAGEMFTSRDLEVLEKVTGQKSKFKPYELSAKANPCYEEYDCYI